MSLYQSQSKHSVFSVGKPQIFFSSKKRANWWQHTNVNRLKLSRGEYVYHWNRLECNYFRQSSINQKNINHSFDSQSTWKKGTFNFNDGLYKQPKEAREWLKEK